MEFQGENPMWWDPSYLEVPGTVLTEENLLDYFRLHNDYDRMSIQKTESDLNSEDNGSIYRVERIDPEIVVIKKYSVQNGKAEDGAC